MPVLWAIIAVAINVPLMALLSGPMGVEGLALALSISASLEVIGLLVGAAQPDRVDRGRPGPPFGRALGGGGGCRRADHVGRADAGGELAARPYWTDGIGRVLVLAVLVAAGAAIFLLVASALRSAGARPAAQPHASPQPGARMITVPTGHRRRPCRLAGAAGPMRRRRLPARLGLGRRRGLRRPAAAPLRGRGGGRAGGVGRRPGAAAAAGSQLLVRAAWPGPRLRRSGGRRAAAGSSHRPARGWPPRPGDRREARAARRGGSAGDQPASPSCAPSRARSRSARRGWWSWPTTRRCWPASTRTRATRFAAPSVRGSWSAS